MTEDIRKKLAQAREAAQSKRAAQITNEDEAVKELVQDELKEIDYELAQADLAEEASGQKLDAFELNDSKKSSRVKTSKSFMDLFIGLSLVMMVIFASLSLDLFSWSGKNQTIKTDDYTYEGKVKRGSYEGPASLSFSNGSLLKGTFKAGKLVGKFEYTDADKNLVQGSVGSQISANIVLANGNKLDYSKGTYEETSNEFSYVGSWDTHGLVYKGNIKFANQAEYEGEFSLGIPNGQGQYKAIDGQVLKGNFVNGVLTNKEE
ncbi:hypothetical protein OZX68_04415 [Streptococcaceae bacterium ESL0729]|nr:hypothetical protein OZX68_04415 [Streptococcaceae bacterium ESL0729]